MRRSPCCSRCLVRSRSSSPSDDVVVPGGARARALLAALLLRPGAVVPVHRLAEVVWGEAQPESVENAVHVTVARLRRALGAAGACVVTRAPGYLLDLRGARVDADLFEEWCRAARTRMDADPAEAARLLDDALALWRGPAFGDLADGFARPAAVRLEELRRGAAEDRAEALLRAGAVEQALAAAGDLAATHPLAERPVAVLVRGLAATGRTADALEAYRRLAGVMREELGLDPLAGTPGVARAAAPRGVGGACTGRRPAAAAAVAADRPGRGAGCGRVRAGGRPAGDAHRPGWGR